MKTPDEMMEYFRSMPKKKKENPYWMVQEGSIPIMHALRPNAELDLGSAIPLLKTVREFFRRYYESFHTEAQVLCLHHDDYIASIADKGFPRLAGGRIGRFPVDVIVLPQDNSGGMTKIDESLWQEYIVNAGITPIARIHSHHILDPYQSMTDYSTLNSGTLEMVIGKIRNDELNVCYWLDVPGTDIKAQTFLAKEKEDGTFTVVPHIFNGPRANRERLKMALSTGAGLDPERDKAILEIAKKSQAGQSYNMGDMYPSSLVAGTDPVSDTI